MRIYKDVIKNIIEKDDVKHISDVEGLANINVLLDFKLSRIMKDSGFRIYVIFL